MISAEVRLELRRSAWINEVRGYTRGRMKVLIGLFLAAAIPQTPRNLGCFRSPDPPAYRGGDRPPDPQINFGGSAAQTPRQVAAAPWTSTQDMNLTR